jgi:preprotein translocase subunit SecY
VIIFFERSYRCVNVQYPKSGNYYYANANENRSGASYVPIKINISGVIPAIFSNAIILFPLTIANFNKGSNWGNILIQNFSVGNFLYTVIYTLLIVFFCFFYSNFVFNVDDVANSLKRGNCIIPGKRPGKSTALYLNYVATRITVLGALYLSFISAVPEIIRYHYYVPFTIGGTSLLIVVSVVLELVSQVQGYLFTSKYDSFIKNFNVSKK